MADVKISELPAVATPADTDQFPINQGGVTKRMTLAQILAAAMAGSFTTIAASGDATIGGDAQASDRTIEINTAAGQERRIAFQSGGVDRWRTGANATAEGGSDAGSGYDIDAYDDAGSLIGTALAFTRADLSALFGGGVQIPSLGVGGAPDAAIGANVVPDALVGTTQIGLAAEPVFASDATVAGYGIKASVETEASAFTLAAAAGLYVPNATKGSGSTITTLYGIYIEEQDQGATNWGLYLAGGNAYFGDEVQIAGALNHDGSTYGLCGATPSSPQTGYTTFSNLSTLRTGDADTLTLPQLCDIVGTLIEDLKTKGHISA